MQLVCDTSGLHIPMTNSDKTYGLTSLRGVTTCFQMEKARLYLSDEFLRLFDALRGGRGCLRFAMQAPPEVEASPSYYNWYLPPLHISESQLASQECITADKGKV